MYSTQNVGPFFSCSFVTPVVKRGLEVSSSAVAQHRTGTVQQLFTTPSQAPSFQTPQVEQFLRKHKFLHVNEQNVLSKWFLKNTQSLTKYKHLLSFLSVWLFFSLPWRHFQMNPLPLRANSFSFLRWLDVVVPARWHIHTQFTLLFVMFLL